MSAKASPETGHELPAGFRLEEFEIKSVLGSGGFGITYLALDVDLKRDVVVKENLPFQCAVRDSTRSVRPRTSAADDTDQFAWAMTSFMREAETLSQFDHPNIVRILRRFQANNTAYFVMPYLPGQSLKQVIDEQVARQEAFPEDELKKLLYPLLDALQVLHAEGVFHRDLKAANIMLVKGHRPILIDFGAARQVISEKSQTVVESAGYTPFEQLQSRGNVGPWSDIYALGATFYTAIHGSAPPRASDRIRKDPIVKLADNYSDVYSRPFLEAMDWALAVDETERPQNVVAWRAALDGGPIVRGSTTATVVPVRKTPREDVTIVKKRKTSPDEPPKPFPVKLVASLVGGLAAAALVVALVIHLLHPLFAKPGSLHVTSDPPQATVHIDGQKDQVTPADFTALKVGKHDVTVSVPGYDPATMTVDIKEGEQCPLDTVKLKRAFGSVTLETIPAHATYRLTAMDDPDAKEWRGTTPATFPSLASGEYKVALAFPNLGSHTVQFTVAPHKAAKFSEDLIKLNVANDANSPAEQAFLGKVPVAQLDDAGKKEYGDLVTRAFTAYLRGNLFAQAAAQVAAMKAIGRDATDMDRRVTQARTSFEQSSGNIVEDLVSERKYGAALSKIKAANESLGKDAADRLTQKFQDKLSAYQSAADDALSQAKQGDPSAGYASLKAFADKNPDDVRLQLALGDLLTKMTPDHDRLGARVAAYKKFDQQYLGMEEAGLFQEMYARLQNELATYDDLATKLKRAKEGPAALARQISSLQDKIADNQRRLASGEGVDKAVNAVTGLFGAHVRVTSAADIRATIEREQNELSQVQAAQQNGSADSSSAQNDFDAFCAKVPW